MEVSRKRSGNSIWNGCGLTHYSSLTVCYSVLPPLLFLSLLVLPSFHALLYYIGSATSSSLFLSEANARRRSE